MEEKEMTPKEFLEVLVDNIEGNRLAYKLFKQALEENEELKKKIKALDKALDLIKQKRENAIQDLKLKTIKQHPIEELKLLKEEIATYNDCIATIEAELGRGK